MDFMVHDCLIEFHPVSSIELKNGHDQDTIMWKKLSKIDKQELVGKRAYMIWSVSQLFYVLSEMKDFIPEGDQSEQLQALSISQFREYHRQAKRVGKNLQE